MVPFYARQAGVFPKRDVVDWYIDVMHPPPPDSRFRFGIDPQRRRALLLEPQECFPLGRVDLVVIVERGDQRREEACGVWRPLGASAIVICGRRIAPRQELDLDRKHHASPTSASAAASLRLFLTRQASFGEGCSSASASPAGLSNLMPSGSLPTASL